MEDHEIIKTLGTGITATTYLAKRLFDGKLVVLKKVKPQEKQSFKDEARALEKLSMYPNCEQYIVCYLGNFSDGYYNYIVTEYIPGQDLYAYLFESGDKDHLETQTLLNMMQQLATGLSYIHRMNYAHRDIKPENILHTERGDLKYIDFGASCSQVCEGLKGTDLYLSPEFLLFPTPTGLEAAQANDIWSLGVTFYVMANWVLPFKLEIMYSMPTSSMAIIRSYIMSYKPKSDHNYGTREENAFINDLIDDMLDKDAKSRPSAQQVEQRINEIIALMRV